MPTQGAELHGEAEVVDHAAANGDLLQVRLGQREVFAQAFRIEGFWQPLLSRTILLDSGLVLQTPGPNMPRETKPAETGAEVSKRLESLKHLLWHGNTEEALERLGDLLMELSFIQARSNAVKKVVDGLSGFETYICNNREFIPNFGEHRRQGETISTAFVESTINQVVSKRFVKKTADAMDAARGASFVADQDEGPQRGSGRPIPPLVSKIQVATANAGGRISDLLKFLVPKVGESFVLDHNVESQEVAQAKPRPELAGALETILELAAL